jgi:hypothetical protein
VDVPALIAIQAQPGVARWWGTPEHEKYDRKVDGTEGVTAFAIVVDGDLAGLIQYHGRTTSATAAPGSTSSSARPTRARASGPTRSGRWRAT